MLTKHFSASEMSCHCRRSSCSALPMDKDFMQKLEALRCEWAKPLIPTSAARCEYWNGQVGGSPHSQHLFSNAADFVFDSPADVDRFVALAEKYGFGGIGRGVRLVHVDGRKEAARWSYADR